jgi:hypothetical protein
LGENKVYIKTGGGIDGFIIPLFIFHSSFSFSLVWFLREEKLPASP